MTSSGTRARGLLVLPTCYIFQFDLSCKFEFFYCSHFEIRLLFQVTLNLKATIFKLMHEIRATYLSNKMKPGMNLSFKVTLSKLKITSGVANLLYKYFEVSQNE